MKTPILRIAIIAITTLMGTDIAMAITRQELATYAQSLRGLKKAELKKAAHELMNKKTVLDYGSGTDKTWWGFYLTDRVEETDECINRYSDQKFQFTSRGSAPSGMNIEHSFAKSWWGGSSSVESYEDLYNLYPSDSKANSAKSNYVMGKVDKFTKSLGEGYGGIGKGYAGSKEVTMWEPGEQYKGDFCRSYMYMATTYQHLTWASEGLNQLSQNEWPTLQEWAYTLFLEWSRRDSVSAMEIYRNNAVSIIQSNRNLFVDYPNFCEYIWGDSMNVAFDPENAITTASDDERYRVSDGTLTEPEIPEDTTTLVGSGTEADPYNVASIIHLVEAMDADVNSEEMCVRGIITSIKEVSTAYGNATYYISDDAEGSNKFYVYRGKWLNGENFTNENAIHVGDTVVIKGLYVNYKGSTPETVANKNHIASIKYCQETEDNDDDEPVGDGTLENPYNVASALQIITALDADVYSEEMCVRGIITSIKEVSTAYGNATYYISDDAEASNQLYIYRSKWLDGADFTDENAIHVGDTVIVKGLYVNYKGNLPESVVNQSYIVNLNIADGIQIPCATVHAAEVYDLTGKKVKNITQPGIYLKNGKKFIKLKR